MINLDKIRDEYNKVSRQLSSDDILQDREKYANLAKRFSYLEKLLDLLNERDSYLKQKEHIQRVAHDTGEEEEVRALAREEWTTLDEKLKKINKKIEDKIFEESEPEYDLIIEIRAAAGGEESALFAASLFKMYSKYAERNGWKTEVLSSNPTEIGGFKEIIFSLKGKEAYTHLKFESGVHRVQRVPVTESGGRIHTSTVTVAVLIEPKEVELKLNSDDLRIETYRSSGAGGQHVNVTDSAVRITHLPTGIVVACQDERSQIKNREKAMRVLKARIMEKMLKDEVKKMTRLRRIQVGTGERSEKIRTYNFPERRVTDHRINLTIYRLEAVLEGDLDEVVDELIGEERKKIYEKRGLV
ncbi:MAG: peptide chain release factor 1 [Candidatus Omnitrophica bacterium]|nr:peptide chain release factor 1 [Candidatus Omnitrophota bacterium]MBD3269223.1 peptide chain release factor 1 [Candidatus Omnitrophota bacterium]